MTTTTAASLPELFLLDPAEDFDWRLQALCAQVDPESFFPEKGGSPREAKKVCAACDVRGQCLEEALANDERFGIWGGLSRSERRRYAKKHPVRAATSAAPPPAPGNSAA